MAKMPPCVSAPLELVPNGWTTEAWIERLTRLADACKDYNPSQERFLREWIEKVVKAFPPKAEVGSGGLFG